MADDQTTTTPDGKTVPAGDTAAVAVNGPLSADGAPAQKAAGKRAQDKNGDGVPDLDETTPGGRYVLPDGRTVDADGAEVK